MSEATPTSPTDPECQKSGVEQAVTDALAAIPNGFIGSAELGGLIVKKLPEECLSCSKLSCVSEVQDRSDLCYEILSILKKVVPRKRVNIKNESGSSLGLTNFYGEVAAEIIRQMNLKQSDS